MPFLSSLFFFFFVLLQWFLLCKGKTFVRFPDIIGSILLTYEIQRLATINLEKLVHMKRQPFLPSFCWLLEVLRMRKVKL